MKKLLLIAIALCVASSCFAASTGNVPKRIVFKGLNTAAGPISLNEGESPDCLNVHTSMFGTLVRRDGYTNETTSHAHYTTTPAEFNGLFDYIVNSSTSIMVALIDQNLYQNTNMHGVFTPVHAAINPVSDNIASFVNFEGTLIFTTWSKDYGRQWNGVTSTYTHIQLMPRGKYLAVAYQRLFVQNVKIGTTDLDLRFYYSSAGSFTDWGDGYNYYLYDDSSNYETLDAPNGDSGMGWGMCRGNLYGFTTNTVNLINNEGGANPIVPYRRLDGIGCGAPRSIKTVNIPSIGEVMIWLTNDRKIVMWSGGGAVKTISDRIDVTNKISPISVDKINTLTFVYSHAQVYEKKGWYVLWVPTSANAEIYYAIVYDYKTDTIWAFDRQPFKSAAIKDEVDGNNMYVGGYNGKFFKWDDGNSDDSNTINSYWTSRRWDFGWMPMLKKGKEVQITMKTIGNYYLKYEERYDFDTSWTYPQHVLMMPSGGWLMGDDLPAILGTTQSVIGKYDIGNAFNLYQIRLSNNTTNPAYEVYSLDTLVASEGIVGE